MSQTYLTELCAFENLQNMSQSQNQIVGFMFLGLKMMNMTDYDRPVALNLKLKLHIEVYALQRAV